jgi:hypothetical protein
MCPNAPYSNIILLRLMLDDFTRQRERPLPITGLGADYMGWNPGLKTLQTPLRTLVASGAQAGEQTLSHAYSPITSSVYFLTSHLNN